MTPHAVDVLALGQAGHDRNGDVLLGFVAQILISLPLTVAAIFAEPR